MPWLDNWVLVILTSFHYSTNVAIASVPDFRTEGLCLTAGQQIAEKDTAIKFKCVYAGRK